MACTFTGREWDKETGLYYYRARYYDPMEGRFISKDPISFAGGDVNLYDYVLNNSINSVDPSGLAPKDNWFGYNDLNFRDWVHGLKQDMKRAANENFTKADLDALWKEWIGDECPRGKGGTSGRGGGGRGGGGGFGGGCFVEHTEVLTLDGMRPIETIIVGSIVLSRNETSGINEYKRVLEVFQLETHELMELSFGKSTVKVTPIHRFFVETKGWTESGDLKVGDVLLKQDGKRVVVTKSIRYKLDQPVRVYNFGVEGNHNYFVSADTILVHNLKTGGDMLGNPGFHQCFQEDTLVKSNSGNVPIKNIKIGDLVKSINPKTCHFEFQKVTNKYGAETDSYYNVTIGAEKQELIRCTETHKFMVVGRGWVETKGLKIGDVLVTENGNVDIKAIDHLGGQSKIKVYNIELDKNHNYEVSEMGAIVVDRWNSEELECIKHGSEDLNIDDGK